MNTNKRATISVMSTDDKFNVIEFNKVVSLAYQSGCKLLNVRVKTDTEQRNNRSILHNILKSVSELRDTYDCTILIALILHPYQIDIGLLSKFKSIIDYIGIIIEDSSYTTVRKSINKTRRLGIRTSMYINSSNYDYILDMYRKYKTPGIEIETPCVVSYKDVQFEDVKNWIYDKDGTALTIYSNLLTRAILGYSTDCRFSSCIGKQIVYWNGEWYTCPENMKYRLKPVIECSQFSELYNSDAFVSYINKAIKNRDNCKNTCSYYAFCHGGCPFTEQEGACTYITTFELINLVKKEIDYIISQGSLENINSYVRNSIFLKMSSYKEV